MNRLLGLAFVVGLAACGGSPAKSCVVDDDCPSPDYRCAYPIADGCSATGHCEQHAELVCGTQVELCGCDGKVVHSGCSYPDHYASAPTLGAPYSSTCGGGN